MDGLAYMKMSKPTEEERELLPHIILTSDMVWDPTSVDHSFTNANGEVNEYHSALQDSGHFFENFDQRVTLTGESIHPDDDYDFHFNNYSDRAQSHLVNSHKLKLKDPDYGLPLRSSRRRLQRLLSSFAICTACLFVSTSRADSLQPM